MSYSDEGYDEARDNPMGHSVDDDGMVALLRAIPDASTMIPAPSRKAQLRAARIATNADEKANAHAGYVIAARHSRRSETPTGQERHLDALAFIAGVYRATETTFATEEKQYVAAYTALRALRGRFPRPYEAEDLRRASRAAWAARQDVTRVVDTRAVA